MYNHENSTPPSQNAINGALSIYVEGGKKDDGPQMLFGLSVLRHATEEQIQAAMPSVQVSQQMTKIEIQDMLTK